MGSRIAYFFITVGLCLVAGLLASEFVGVKAFLPVTAVAFLLAAAIKWLQRGNSHAG